MSGVRDDTGFRRVPRLAVAERETLGWMCLIALAAGIDGCAIQEAMGNGNWFWAGLFTALLLVEIVLYFWLARWLIHGRV